MLGGLPIEFIRVVQSPRLSEVSVTSKKILLPSNENHTCGHCCRVCLPLRSHRRVNDLVPEPHGLYLLDKQQNFSSYDIFHSTNKIPASFFFWTF